MAILWVIRVFYGTEAHHGRVHERGAQWGAPWNPQCKAIYQACTPRMVYAEGNGANLLFMASTKEHLSKPWRKSWSAMVCAMVCVMRCPTSVERKGTNKGGGIHSLVSCTAVVL